MRNLKNIPEIDDNGRLLVGTNFQQQKLLQMSFLLIETQLEVERRLSTRSLRYNVSTTRAHPSGVSTIQVNKKDYRNLPIFLSFRHALVNAVTDILVNAAILAPR